MVSFEVYVHRNVEDILDKKSLLHEIRIILRDIGRIEHEEIKAEFSNKGWALEQRIFPEALWAWDAYKDKVAVSVELSLIDAVHRDFLRAILAHKRGSLHALVYITSTFKEPKYHNVKRDIEIFNEILPVPILLVGLT